MVAQQLLLVLLDVRVVQAAVADTLKLVALQHLGKEMQVELAGPQQVLLLMEVLAVVEQVL